MASTELVWSEFKDIIILAVFIVVLLPIVVMVINGNFIEAKTMSMSLEYGATFVKGDTQAKFMKDNEEFEIRDVGDDASLLVDGVELFDIEISNDINIEDRGNYVVIS